MKKYFLSYTALLFIALSFSSCKKENTAAIVKDYSSPIKNKTWWGTLTNAGESPQYYSVHFNADNSLQWSQFSSDYNGTWTVDKNKLTMTFTSPAVIVTADIADDNKFVNITTSTANKVNSGQAIENANIALDNTIWSGGVSFILLSPFMKFSFFPGSLVQTKLGSTTYATGAYTRTASGGAIRFTVPILLTPMFCIITSNGVMNGSYNFLKNTWQLNKE